MKNSPGKSILWFRQDLRLHDNPALTAAVEAGDVLPIFILDDHVSNKGSASQVWLHHSLIELDRSLDGNLSIYRGDPLDVISDIISRQDIDAVYWNRCYEPSSIERDKTIKNSLSERSIFAQSFNGSLLWEPWEVLKADNTPYRVFTPFYRRGCLSRDAPRTPLPKPKNIQTISDDRSMEISELSLLPQKNRWDVGLIEHWRVGEAAALDVLNVFLEKGLHGYKMGRNFPAQSHISRLSPYLHWGQISPNTAWYAARALGENDDIDHFCSELGWREFSYSLLYNFPTLPSKNFQSKFDAFPWKKNDQYLDAWRKGKTGVPIVDAGMRELWQTGYMHNRVRMIVASYLVKNLRIDWREGEKWFWDTLFDADLANNSASWQWVAGSGADAAPYFRIFNPVTQGEKFDPDGEYIRRYVPELSRLSGKHLFAPWMAPADSLQAADIRLGDTYPEPIVDLKTSRQEALAAFKSLKSV